MKTSTCLPIPFFDRDVFVEKHWKSVISRSVCDHFFEALSKVFFLTASCSSKYVL